MVHQTSGWFFAPLYSFDTSSTGNGIDPQSPVVIGPDGSLYGTSNICGIDGQGCETYGCGVVYNLRLPVRASASALGLWTETVIFCASHIAPRSIYIQRWEVLRSDPLSR